MSVHELRVALADPVPDFALARLQRWAAERPLQVALRHRRQGVWKAWRWIDVQREVERMAAALREQGLGPESRLALCGAFEPTLLLLALAARRVGTPLAPVSRLAKGEELRRRLRLLRPDFAYVQRRENVSDWLAVGADGPLPLRLFSAQASGRSHGACRVLPLAAVVAGELPERRGLGWPQVSREEVAWNDEGTEWADGLGRVLAQWLDEGIGFAFPETSESAERDRRDIAPTILLSSDARLQAMGAEIDQRLAPPGSWRRRLCDWTLRDPRRGVRRWLKARVRQLLGFQRLRRIVPGGGAPLTASGPAWIGEYLERVA